ncbi:hypothetical protein IEO21_09603 [Rhodonia placenta]|uniref:Uncharacterized protein n=1 Tax=Rhodonia placenta TaxID=104341 RepID=A0A8H7NUH0_9APHY|nr:hypothetical protein IEO21_09603 [Postia placenta]
MYVPHAIVPYGHRYARGQTCPAPFAPLFQQTMPSLCAIFLLPLYSWHSYGFTY